MWEEMRLKVRYNVLRRLSLLARSVAFWSGSAVFVSEKPFNLFRELLHGIGFHEEAHIAPFQNLACTSVDRR